MSFLLDTNVVSELRRADKCHPNVANWQKRVAPENSFISVITVMEIRAGIISAHRTNPQFGIALERWYSDRVLPSFAGRILAVDLLVAEKCGAILAGRSRPITDTLIAATAAAHDLTLVTRNVSDFTDAGVHLLNPWTESSDHS
ncbi:MAG: type II toxin-antitoxin system VapC family toxin [Luteolibacter sp.]|uniref:type II toxin-antitoxin system VapC family toxin n=1 Tax=Luteolibacter sp. TaxID=1962973 RepID=UPI003264B0C9